MEIMSLLFALAMLLNIILFYMLMKKSGSKTTHSIEARELLKDLLDGSALIKIQVIDKESIFLRSPKDL